MKQITIKNKLNFLSGCLGIIVFSFVAVNFALASSSFAGPCKTNGDCESSLICDRGTMTCIYDDGSGGIPGGASNFKACTGASDCASTQTCYNGACIDKSSTGTNPCAGVTCIAGCTCSTTNGGICVLSSDNSKPCTTTSDGLGGTTNPGSGGVTKGDCNGDPNLEFKNGICLPISSKFPSTGIAGESTLSGLLLAIIKLLLTFAGVIAVVMLVLGGYWYMAAGGNEEMSEKGKKTIINFVLGLVVVLLAYTIVTIISDTLTSTQYIK